VACWLGPAQIKATQHQLGARLGAGLLACWLAASMNLALPWCWLGALPCWLAGLVLGGGVWLSPAHWLACLPWCLAWCLVPCRALLACLAGLVQLTGSLACLAGLVVVVAWCLAWCLACLACWLTGWLGADWLADWLAG